MLKLGFMRIVVLFVIILLCFSEISESANSVLSDSKFAQTSVLSSGKWVRVEVGERGIYKISNEQLKRMGFFDPVRVNVYGYGGQQLSEQSLIDRRDDLQMLPVRRVADGLLFFALDNVTWHSDDSGYYIHKLNEYSSKSYYFLSDRESEVAELGVVEAPIVSTGIEHSSYICRLIHEEDIEVVAESGRLLLGEDFIKQKSRHFNFQLVGAVDNRCVLDIGFGAKTTGGASSILVKVNGNVLKSLAKDIIPASSTSDYIQRRETRREFEVVGTETADVTIDYNHSGTLITSRLDYLRLFYHRELALTGGELYFYGNYDEGDCVRIKNTNKNVEVWDVTNPQYPRKITTTLKGSEITFLSNAGYREYIAFDVNGGLREVKLAGRISNQNIHGIDTPDMVIVSPAEYMQAARRLANLHEKYDGFQVAVVTPEEVYNEFSGGHTDLMAFRRMLKMWYDRKGSRELRYCLMFGRGSYDTKGVSTKTRQLGYKTLPLWQSISGNSETSSYSTDDILGMLEESETEFDIKSAKISVAVGRLPIKSAQEAETVVDKIEQYMLQPNLGNWRNRIMLIADDGDNAIHLDQSEDVYSELKKSAPHFHYDRVYLDSYKLDYTSIGATYIAAKERMLRNWQEGVLLTNYIGHASPTSWTHEKLLTWDDITSLKSSNPSFLFAATCSFGCWDGNSVSGAEEMLLNPRGGMVGIITPSRTVFMEPNGRMSGFAAKWMLATAKDGKGTRIGDAYKNAKNSFADENKLRFCLMSDPALRISKPSREINIKRINDVVLSDTSQIELQPLSRVSIEGTIENCGEIDEDFSGNLTLELYDAETPITTNGNGATGEVRTYNDRKSRLSIVGTEVKSGRWQAELFIPQEIANNFTPARILAYSYNQRGEEAHGSTESLYVYGEVKTDIEDKEGPKIHNIYINKIGFKDGDLVGPNSVVYVELSDSTGINISESGLGHRMWISIDGKQYFSDVSSYYIPDLTDYRKGNIVYPLKDLADGEHRMELAVYDNANNVSRAEVNFKIGRTGNLVIRSLKCNSVNESDIRFSTELDMPNSEIVKVMTIYDLEGRIIWNDRSQEYTDINGAFVSKWGVVDMNGCRVDSGIYICRMGVETKYGMKGETSVKFTVSSKE